VTTLSVVSTETEMEVEDKTFSLFLQALKKDLAGSSSVVVGVVSIGVSNSSGVAADREERPKLFLKGSSSPISLVLLFLTGEGL
jgi:hypothetical protein